VAGRLGEHDDAHGGEERHHDHLAQVPRPALGVGEVHHICSVFFFGFREKKKKSPLSEF
jgi:hypothetical protein